jgi:cyanophycinase
MGGGYSDIYAGFAAATLACARGDQVNIVVLPTAYASHAEQITDAERAANLKDAEWRRGQIEAACRRAAPAGVRCTAVVAPIFTRADAADAARLAPLLGPVSAVFMLGGDQTVAMAALAGTPAEAALEAIHRAGGVIGGTSAGGGMLAAEMLGGYQPNFTGHNSLDVGAVDIWNRATRRGLSFGVPGAILDQHFFQRGRFGRLLNAITAPGAPTLGIGIDAYTGALVDAGPRGRLRDVFGLYGVAVLDAGTYHAAATVQYTPLEERGRAPVLSVRNVLVHLLAPGPVSFDLGARCTSLGAPEPHVARAFTGLQLPPDAGVLLLGGDLSAATGNDPVLARFRSLAERSAGCVLIYADGYDSDGQARRAAEVFGRVLGLPAEVRTADDLAACSPEAFAATSLRAADYSGVVLLGRDQSQVDVPALRTWLPRLWHAGLPVLADNALAAVTGAYYSAHGPTPAYGAAAERATQRAWCAGETVIEAGLGLVPVTVEPQVLADNRWGRYFSLAHTHPELVALGLNRGAAVEIGADGAWSLGENVTFALDLRRARLAHGENRGFVVANGLLDVFAPGDEVRPEVATVNLTPPTPMALPQLPVCPPDRLYEPEPAPRTEHDSQR